MYTRPHRDKLFPPEAYPSQLDAIDIPRSHIKDRRVRWRWAWEVILVTDLSRVGNDYRQCIKGIWIPLTGQGIPPALQQLLHDFTMADVPSTLKPAQTAVALVEMAVAKHNTRYDKTFLKAVLAGVMLSFGGLLDVILAGGSPSLTASNPGLVKVLGGFVFPVGLVMIVLQNLDLLTSSFMIFPMAAIKRAIPWWGVPLNWIIVLFGNLVGSLFFAAVLAKSDGLVTVDPYLTYVRDLAVTKAVTPAWDQILLRGIGCNWLVCVAIWQSTAASETFSKVIATWFPIWVFVACGYDHVIANMFSLPLGIMLHANLTTAVYIKKSLIASLIGNIIGGLFVGLPAVYFYLGDWNAGGLRDAEEAQEKTSVTSSQDK